MGFTLGSILVKGGKIISTGHNHHRHHYDGFNDQTRGNRKPVSMHAEMDAIRNFTGMTPSFKKQLKGTKGREVIRKRRARECRESAILKDSAGTEWCLRWTTSAVQMSFVPGAKEYSDSSQKWGQHTPSRSSVALFGACN
jgi:hypothetical protein